MLLWPPVDRRWVPSYYLNEEITIQEHKGGKYEKDAVLLVALCTCISLIAMPACTTINPYTEEKQTSRC